MPTRNFCDICDSYIESNAKYFRLHIKDTNPKREISYYKGSDNIRAKDGTWLTFTSAKDMVCRSCIEAIRLLMHDLKNKEK